MPILVCLFSGLSGGSAINFLVTHGCFPKKPIIFEIYIELKRVLMPNLSGFEKFCFQPYGREVWEVRFKSSLCMPRYLVRVAEAPADHESPWM